MSPNTALLLLSAPAQTQNMDGMAIRTQDLRENVHIFIQAGGLERVNHSLENVIEH